MKPMGLCLFGFRWVAIAAVLAVFVGCGSEPVAKDPREALRKAEEFRNREDYEQAERLYLEALHMKPDLAAAHRALGLLYQDHLDKPIHALHHYERYKEIEQEAGRVIASAIDPRIQSCKKRLLTQDLSLNILNQRLIQDRRQAEIERDKAYEAAKAVEAQRQDALAKRDEREAQLAAVEQEVIRLQQEVRRHTGPDKRIPPKEASEVLAALLRVETTLIDSYTVKRGDTFSGIASKHLVTTERLKALNANPPINYNVLRLGQQIFVPKNR